jgi:hypothetical protein
MIGLLLPLFDMNHNAHRYAPQQNQASLPTIAMGSLTVLASSNAIFAGTRPVTLVTLKNAMPAQINHQR